MVRPTVGIKKERSGLGKKDGTVYHGDVQVVEKKGKGKVAGGEERGRDVRIFS